MSDVAQLLERLIGVRTHNPGGDERAMAVFLREQLELREADEVSITEVPRGGAIGAYVFARWGRPRVLVNAHLDTVPPNDGWQGDPFVARRHEGRLIGLGACDTKGAIAAILCALDEAQPRDLAILFSGDEEHRGTCIRAFLADERARGIAQAIVCEPTSCRAGTRHRGVLAFEVALEGPGGHSSLADTLPAPLAELARLAVAYDEWGRRQRPLGPKGFTGMCTNVAALDGGIAFNVVPARGKLCVSVRPPPGADVGAVRAELARIATEVVPRATHAAPVENPPFATRALETFRPLIGEIVDAPIDLAFWTEAAALSQAGIDAVVYGPGDIAQAHAPDEWVALAELDSARATFARLFRATASGEGDHGVR